jgi:seryl-tRNA synthetase
MVLSSAVCYQCYREFAGRTLETPLTRVTAQGQCFRNERGAFRTLDRLYEFTMREIIMLGDPAMIDGQRMKLLYEVVGIAEMLGMAGTVETATDFFFRGDVDGRARALHQRANALKLELRVRMDDEGGSLAVASFNLHEDYFGRSFDIKMPDGSTACTGCVGFGIERWVSAFLAYHGADPMGWPAAVRENCAVQRRRSTACRPCSIAQGATA